MPYSNSYIPTANIRTRFAPSPTGYIHVGNVRAALFPWLFARGSGGKFVVRIEDTDQARYVEGAEALILDSLKWVGMDWDEGPQVGGPYAPYIQSERTASYMKYAKLLIEKGLAYADPYTPEEVNVFREQAKAQKKPFLFRDFRPENPPVWDGSTPLRLKVTNVKRYTWHDPVMGELTAGPEALDDFILIKSDGMPTYNFAHIIDDFEMKITHVIRGLEYIPSIPKYLSLYEALEITPPILVCLPHIMAPDGKKKLGKRDGAKSVTEYKDAGILPEAMLNFLASMGWNDGTEQEIFSRDELIAKFSFDRVQRSGARFDEQRLLWLNGQWIRRLDIDDLLKRVDGFWSDAARQVSDAERKKVLTLVQDRLKTLADVPLLTAYFFEEPTPDWAMVDDNKQLAKIERHEQLAILRTSITELASSNFDSDSIQATLNHLLETTGQKPGIVFSLIRLAVSWAPFSPALNDTLAALGQATTLQRLQRALDAA